MLQLKVGVQLASLRLPLKKALHTAAEMGADAVEIDARGEIKPRDLSRSGVRQMRKMLEDLNLRVCAIGFRTRRGYDVADDLDRRIEATKEAMQMAYALGAQVVVNQIGRVPSDLPDASWDTLRQALVDLGGYGQRVGAFLAARTGSEAGADLARLISALPAGVLAVDFDPGSLIINGFSASDAIRALAPHVLHVHANDAVRDLAQGRGIETPLGRGSVDFLEMLSVLEEQEYRGYLTVERQNSANPVADVAQGVEYLRNLAL